MGSSLQAWSEIRVLPGSKYVSDDYMVTNKCLREHVTGSAVVTLVYIALHVGLASQCYLPTHVESMPLRHLLLIELYFLSATNQVRNVRSNLFFLNHQHKPLLIAVCDSIRVVFLLNKFVYWFVVANEFNNQTVFEKVTVLINKFYETSE